MFKIDIEEYEFSDGGFTDWISSGSLKNVGQIAIELHVENHEQNERWTYLEALSLDFNLSYFRQYIDLLGHLQDLYNLGRDEKVI